MYISFYSELFLTSDWHNRLVWCFGILLKSLKSLHILWHWGFGWLMSVIHQVCWSWFMVLSSNQEDCCGFLWSDDLWCCTTKIYNPTLQTELLNKDLYLMEHNVQQKAQTLKQPNLDFEHLGSRVGKFSIFEGMGGAHSLTMNWGSLHFRVHSVSAAPSLLSSYLHDIFNRRVHLGGNLIMSNFALHNSTQTAMCVNYELMWCLSNNGGCGGFAWSL